MDKQQALIELAALRERADALEKIINTPEVAPSLLGKPVPGSGQPYYAIGGTVVTGRIARGNYKACAPSLDAYNHGNIFTDRATAEAYAEAVDTLLLLRHQPGTEPAVCNKNQYLIEPESDGSALAVRAWMADLKIALLSPCFGTEEQSEAAIKAIGKDRILRMFKTFHHIR